MDLETIKREYIKMRHVFSKQEFFRLVNMIKNEIELHFINNPKSDLKPIQVIGELDFPMPYSPVNHAIKQITGQWPSRDELKAYTVTDWHYVEICERERAEYNY